MQQFCSDSASVGCYAETQAGRNDKQPELESTENESDRETFGGHRTTAADELPFCSDFAGLDSRFGAADCPDFI